jgi:hypothetical protein
MRNKRVELSGGMPGGFEIDGDFFKRPDIESGFAERLIRVQSKSKPPCIFFNPINDLEAVSYINFPVHLVFMAFYGMRTQI